MAHKRKHRFKFRDTIYRLLWTGQFREKECTHLDQIQVMHSTTHVCQDCVDLGDTWLHLRMCMVCGYVGCCDKAKNQHSLKHFQATGHPIMRSVEPGEDWMWCYIDKALISSDALSSG